MPCISYLSAVKSASAKCRIERKCQIRSYSSRKKQKTVYHKDCVRAGVLPVSKMTWQLWLGLLIRCSHIRFASDASARNSQFKQTRVRLLEKNRSLRDQTLFLLHTNSIWYAFIHLLYFLFAHFLFFGVLGTYFATPVFCTLVNH